MSAAQTLRPYQLECVESVELAWERRNGQGHVLRPGCSLATGAGKTTIIAELIRRFFRQRDIKKVRVLVMAHTTEIIDQMRDRIANQLVEVESWYVVGGRLVPSIGVVRAAENAFDARCVVATRQSLNSERLAQILAAGAIDLLVVDEAHHDTAGTTYQYIENTLRSANPELLKVGFSATWHRGDKKALAMGYDEIVAEWTILDGILGGYLVPVTALQIKSNVNLDGVRSVRGDFDARALASMLDASNWLELAVDAYRTYIESARKRTMAFFASVSMSRKFVAQLSAEGVSAAHVDGETPKDKRKEILKAYHDGEIQLVSNYNVLTEGFDEPLTDSILWGRPTKQPHVFAQGVGRGVRIAPGKVDCFLLDIAAKGAKLVMAHTLLGKMKECSKCGASFFLGLECCPQCHAPVEATKRERDGDGAGGFLYSKKSIMQGLAAEVVSIFDRMSAAWYKGKDEYLSCQAGAGVLVIAPPTWADVNRQRDRLSVGSMKLAQISMSERARRDKIAAKMGQLRREIARSENYTLYYVPSDRNEPIEYLRANQDLPSLLAEGDIEALRRGDNRDRRDSRFHTSPQLATVKQINLLIYVLGAKPSEFPKPFFKGAASQMIAHYKSVPDVKTFIEQDTLPAVPEKEAVA